MSSPLSGNGDHSQPLHPQRDPFCLCHSQSPLPNPEKPYLGQLPKVWPHPAQFIQHTLVKLGLLFAAVTKHLQVGIIETSPVLCERLCTVTLDLPGKEDWRLGIALHTTE